MNFGIPRNAGKFLITGKPLAYHEGLSSMREVIVTQKGREYVKPSLFYARRTYSK
jgi:hypothetical protein